MKTLEIRAILNKIKYLDWSFTIAHKPENEEVPDYLQVIFPAQCTKTGSWEGWRGRKWALSPHMVKSEIITTAFKAVMTAIEHEARESFLVEGYPIFGPHISVDVLLELYKSKDPTEVRSVIDRNLIT